jgi:hypothetical protein
LHTDAFNLCVTKNYNKYHAVFTVVVFP